MPELAESGGHDYHQTNGKRKKRCWVDCLKAVKAADPLSGVATQNI